ncbi:MAG: DUF192 domain-containing protein [Patescibacteria group bacterium]
MKTLAIVLALVWAVLIAAFVFFSFQTPPVIDTSLQFEIVRTPEAQAKGLSGRTDVPQGYGMLFVFPKEERLAFWMKDMLVPIDILWLSSDGTILGIEDSVSPDSYPQKFLSPEPVRLVLELRAGESRVRNFTIGSRIALPPDWQK